MGARNLLHHLRGAGFRLAIAGDKLLVAPASRLTDADGASIAVHKVEILALLAIPVSTPARIGDRPYRLARAEGDAAHAEPWEDAAIARFEARAGSIERLSLAQLDAEDLAERLHLRDVQADHRHLCLECSHYRPGRCGNHRAAALVAAEVGRDLATMFQDCPGFKSRGE